VRGALTRTGEKIVGPNVSKTQDLRRRRRYCGSGRGTSTHQDCAKYEVIDQGLIHHLQERMSAKINHESYKFGDLEQLDRPTPTSKEKNTGGL
jgi:hypothetical protein